MSNKKNQNQENKRGTKRNATHLLSTNDKNNNTQNPHPPKKQRTSKQKYDLQLLLQMSPSEINALPQPLKTQAIAFRKKRNITNKSSRSNNNIPPQQTQMPPMPPAQTSHESDDESENEMTNVTQTQQQNIDPINVPQQHNHNSNVAQVYPHNTIPNMFHSQQQPFRGNVTANISQNQSSLHYNPQQFQTMQATQPRINNMVSNSNSDSNAHSAPRYINIQDLMGKDDKKSNYGFCYKFWGVIGMILLFMPCLMSIQWSNSYNNYGSNYCDINSNEIRAKNITDCIQCPINATYCMNGKAKCANKFMVDIHSNECVEILYKKNVINAYKNTWNLVSGWVKNLVMSVVNNLQKWTIEGWKSWFMHLQSLSFVEFCKFYEMEIMLSFFGLTYFIPVLRLLVIFLWTRMVLPMVNDGEMRHDEWIVICLNILSYFAPMMFCYEIWDKITALIG